MTTPHIKITYSRTTPESVEFGNFSDTGWVDEEGVEIELDEYDIEGGTTLAQKAANLLKREGALYPSSSPSFHKGVWYSTEWSTVSFRTGEEEEKSFHLWGFTEDQEQQVFNLVMARPS